MAYSRRKAALRRRRIFLTCVVLVLAALSAAAIFAVRAVLKRNQAKNESAANKVSSSSVTSVSSVQSTVSSEKKDTYNPDQKEIITVGSAQLDANFRRVLLVNASNPLPENYDALIKDKLVTIDAKYRNNNNVTDIHKDVYPYITAMVAAANADGVGLKVWSPFRSIATQRVLFENQVKRMNEKGYVGEEAERQAATVVMRPGYSEHNTGLCADFNMANDSFEGTKMFTWMQEHAEDYGFILRYPKDGQDKTGIIYEPWHWRFVGINTAKEMNRLGVTLEEYIELKEIDFKSELN